MTRLRKLHIYLLAWWSGFFVMAIELLGGRVLAPYFGGSIYVWGAIITVFMLALSIGYLVGGRLSTMHPTLERLGLLLVAAALACLPTVWVGTTLLESIFGTLNDPRYGSLCGAALLFFLPTAISGAVSPYAIRLLVSQLKDSGKSAGGLYFVSTFGSAAGTIITSFYLVLWFDLNDIFLGLLSISVLLGLTPALVVKFKHA